MHSQGAAATGSVPSRCLWLSNICLTEVTFFDCDVSSVNLRFLFFFVKAGLLALLSGEFQDCNFTGKSGLVHLYFVPGSDPYDRAHAYGT